MHPLLGSTSPHYISQALGTGFEQFHSPTGISGLAKENKGRLEILAVDADNPGHGQFRAFIAQMKQAYLVIVVWFVGNPDLESALERYGFKRHSETDNQGEFLEGWKWE